MEVEEWGAMHQTGMGELRVMRGQAAWYVINNPLTHSPLCCVRTVILINSLCVGGGGGGDGVSIQTRTYFPSLDNNAVRETKRCIKKKLEVTYLHSPGTLQIPWMGLQPCLQMAFEKEKRKRHVWICPKIVKNSFI